MSRSEGNDSKLNVIVTSRGPSYESLGGPALGIRLMMEQYAKSKNLSLLLTAVFCDKTITNASDFDIKEPSAKRRLPSKLLAAIYVSKTASSLMRLALRLIKSERISPKPLIFHANDFTSAALLSLIFRGHRPEILTIHARGGGLREILIEYPFLEGSFLAKLADGIERRAISSAKIITFTSNGSQQLFEEAHPNLLRGKNVKIVHLGVDVDRLTAERESLKDHSRDPTIRILCVGALVRDKGIDTLVKALPLLPPHLLNRVFCTIVAREGYMKQEVDSLIAQNSLEDIVKLLGFVHRPELIQLMADATMFVLPSRVSVFDAILLEVSAFGLPIITTAVGGNLEMFDSESAILIPPDDERQLAKAITKLANTEDLRSRLTRNAQERMRRKFSNEGTFQSYLSLYDEVAN